MNKKGMTKPTATEYADYYDIYVSLIDSDNILAVLNRQISDFSKLLSEIPEEKGVFRYAEGKWSINELVGHLIDTERIMAYRALRFSRNDKTDLEGFDQDPYIENSDFDGCKLSDLAQQFKVVRQSNIFMFEGLASEAWDRSGKASGSDISVRALAYIIAGHELHHVNILKERYLA